MLGFKTRKGADMDLLKVIKEEKKYQGRLNLIQFPRRRLKKF